MATPAVTFSTDALFAAWQTRAPAVALFGPAAALTFWWFRGALFRSEKADGCIRPLLWILAIFGGVGVLTAGAWLALREYSHSDPRFSQDAVVVLCVAGMLAVAGLLLWAARTTEGERLLAFVWLTLRVAGAALIIALFVLAILLGTPHH